MARSCTPLRRQWVKRSQSHLIRKSVTSKSLPRTIFVEYFLSDVSSIVQPETRGIHREACASTDSRLTADISLEPDFVRWFSVHGLCRSHSSRRRESGPSPSRIRAGRTGSHSFINNTTKRESKILHSRNKFISLSADWLTTTPRQVVSCHSATDG